MQQITETCGVHVTRDYIIKRDSISASKASYTKGSFFSLFSSIFLPEGYPHSVSEDYLQYQVWDTLQALCSSVTGVLCTRAILKGVGVGNENATVTGAAIQWVIRDGSGMIGRILFAWKNGTALDSDAKTWRLMADILNDIGMTLEMISPIFPAFFLPIACAGTIAKSITGVAGGCSRAALTQHFARRDNLGDVSAKDGSQETAVSLGGMILGMVVTSMLANEASGGEITWALFFVFTVLHLFCNYRGLRACNLQTFNRQRANIFLKQFVESGAVLDPKQVSQRERILFFDFELPRIDLGVPIERAFRSDVMKLQKAIELYQNEKYILTINDSISVCLKSDADPLTMLKSYFQAAYIRLHWQAQRSDKAVLERESFSYVNKHFDLMVQKMTRLGWRSDRCHLNPTEWRFATRK